MPTATDTLLARHDAYMTNNYARVGVAMLRGDGAQLWDAEGKAYIDLFAGFGAPILGHCNPELTAALVMQAGKLWHVGNILHTEPQTLLAEKLSRHSEFDAKCFFCHSGADANEAAVKLARLYGRKHPRKSPAGHRYGVISTLGSFHGRSFVGMALTGQPKIREGFDPLAPGFVNVTWNDISAIENAIDANTVAVVLEPIQGEGGVHVPSIAYMKALRALCDKHDLLLVCDEVWTGCARTGRDFAFQHFGIVPDAVTLAKGVGGGMTLGAVMIHPKHAELFDWRAYGRAVHGTTLGGNCLATAVAAKVWEIVERDQLTFRAADLGAKIKADMTAMATRVSCIKEVRGLGLFVGVELDCSQLPGTLKDASGVFKKCLEKGLLINATQGTTLRIAPCLTVDAAMVSKGLGILEDVLKNG